MSGLLGADTPTPAAGGATAPDFSLPSGKAGWLVGRITKANGWCSIFARRTLLAACTLEAHNFERDLTQVSEPERHHSRRKKRRLRAIPQDFCAKEGLNFKLLADPDLKAVTKCGSAMENGVKMAARNTFLIDPEGKIARVYLREGPAGHSEQVLKDLAVLKKG